VALTTSWVSATRFLRSVAAGSVEPPTSLLSCRLLLSTRMSGQASPFVLCRRSQVPWLRVEGEEDELFPPGWSWCTGLSQQQLDQQTTSS